MLLKAFNKQITPELKDAYQTYGDKLVRTVMNDKQHIIKVYIVYINLVELI